MTRRSEGEKRKKPTAELQITQALTAQFITIRDELADLRRRAEAAAKPGWWQR